MALLLGLATILCALVAHASTAPPPVRLSYVRGEGAESCPAESVLRQRVAAHLGYLPWRSDGTRVIEVLIERRDGELVANLRLIENEAPLGTRTLSTRDPGCDALADAVALAVSIAVDPLLLTRPRDAPGREEGNDDDEDTRARTPVSASGSRSEREPWRGDRVLERRSSRLRLELGARAIGSLGMGPAPSAGLRVSTGARLGLFSLALEARADLPSAATVPGGELSTTWAGAGLVPCVRLDPVGVCAPLIAGAWLAEGRGLIGAQTHWLPSAAAGVRAFAGVPLSSWLELRLSVDVLASLVRVTLQDTLTHAPLWRSPPLSATVACGLWIRL